MDAVIQKSILSHFNHFMSEHPKTLLRYRTPRESWEKSASATTS